MIVSDRTGIVGVPVAGPGPWPLAAEVPRFRAGVHQPGGPVTVAGAALDGDVDTALARCVAEGVERYAAMVPRPDAWLAAVDGTPVARNAVLGHLSPLAAPPEDGYYPQGSTGLAAGPTLAAATESAAAEVVERDTLARAWRAGTPMPRTALPAALAELALAEELSVSAHLLPVRATVARVAVVALRHGGRRLIGVGSAYRPEPVDGLAKAFTEAVVSLAQQAELADPVTGPGLAAGAGLDPWRADRRYAAGGWAHVADIAQHAQLLLDPELQEAVWERFVGLGFETVAAQPPQPAASVAAMELLDDAVLVELSTPDCAPYVVVRVLAAGAEVVRPAGDRPEELPCPLV
ncbi:YcaO-like family protein [Nocardioides speluncae]|uniref:YcaO-like family protein n=1 Tax=Nocardioides speluncae TaxID=2670337 RepID=UPI000D68D9B5|nr:YcaO-like family protein [Nocardioides speluncae]